MALLSVDVGDDVASTYVIDTFRGINYTDDPTNVDKTMSPYAPNMIRDVPGKVRKCMGWHTTDIYSGRINGYHKLRSENAYLLHAGTNIYKVSDEEKTLLYEEANDERSRSFQFSSAEENGVPKQTLVIQDGKSLLIYDGSKIVTAASIAKIPTITIGKGTGNSSSYEAFNLLQPKYREQWNTTTEKSFTMALSPLDEGSDVVLEKKNETADWEIAGEWKDGADSHGLITSVDYKSGTITIGSAIENPITGEDNIRITVSRTVEGYADRVNKCTIAAQFGVNGAADRLFVSGNPDSNFLNYDWYSGQYDPTYWPDTGYATLGNSASAVMGYSIVNNYLAAHKDNRETDRNIIIRQGSLVESEPAFPIINTLQGPGAIAKNSFAYLEAEPMFLTGSGVYAITTSDLSGEKYSQRRSYYCNGALLKESGLDDAVACVYNDMYWLCVNGKAYILDGLQHMTSNHIDPYSSRQYACFERTNLPARVMWVSEKNELCFGTADGHVCAFYTEPKSGFSYSDDGDPINAVWRTPSFGGTRFWYNKNFKYFAVQIAPAIASVVDMYAQKNGLWKFVKTVRNASYFTFGELHLDESFTFSANATARTGHTKTRIKKTDKVAYELRNFHVNQPFGIMSLAIEYTESGRYKR